MASSVREKVRRSERPRANAEAVGKFVSCMVRLESSKRTFGLLVCGVGVRRLHSRSLGNKAKLVGSHLMQIRITHKAPPLLDVHGAS